MHAFHETALPQRVRQDLEATPATADREGANVAGFNIDLGLGAAVNPGVLTASVVIFFSMTAALLCVTHNRLGDRTFGRSLTSVCSWFATIAAFAFFILTLALVPIALAVEVGL